MAAALLLTPLLAPAQNNATQQSPNLELRLKPGKFVNGVPESFTFIFVNISNHDVRMPQPSRCFGSVDGALYLGLELKPPQSVLGFGCGGGIGGSGHVLAMRDQAKNWKALKPGESLSVTLNRNLFVIADEPGRYDFWAEYSPPKISAEDQRALTEAGIDFPREQLASTHLVFVRKPSLITNP